MYLDNMGWECFNDKFPCPTTNINEEPALKKYATFDQYQLAETIIATQECVFVMIGSTTTFMLKLEERPIVWLLPTNIS
jgi:hypothetical protein